MKSLTPLLFLFVLAILPFTSFAGETSFSDTVIYKGVNKIKFSDTDEKSFLSFSGASFDQEKNFLPYFRMVKSLPKSEKIISASFESMEFVPMDKKILDDLGLTEYIKEDLQLEFDNGIRKKEIYGIYSFVPIRKNPNTGEIERLVSYEIKLYTSPQSPAPSALKKNKTNSVLSTGKWYKVAVTENGVYKLDYQFLKNLGLDVDNIDPRNIRLYGNGGKMLPLPNNKPRPDDLKENSIYVEGENDGSFDSTDYVAFYGSSPHKWSYLPANQKFSHQLHEYSDTNYYFINADIGTGKRISNINSSSQSSTHTVSTFNDFEYYEKDRVNLIKSGQKWFGESFDVVTSYSFSFNFPNIVTSSPVEVEIGLATRSNVLSTYTFKSGSNKQTHNVGALSAPGCYYCQFAKYSTDNMQFNPSSSVVKLDITYNKPNTFSKGWLDYVRVNARRNLILTGDQMRFRDVQSVGSGNIAEYLLTNSGSSVKIWEITDVLNPTEINTSLSGNTMSFKLAADSLREFVAFKKYKTNVYPVGEIQNQNLHSLSDVDYVILSHPRFHAEALDLAKFHKGRGLNVEVVTPEQVYNEFSSGVQDIVAIRDFIRMLYNRASNFSEMPRYLLMFGDGSYDNKDRIPGNTNFIPTFQSPASLEPISSYVSDDFYGLLDSTEGVWANNSGELIDIGVGRFPVQSKSQAQSMVNKVKNYDISSTMRDWRNNVVFIGDDEDSNIHMSQADELADTVVTHFKDYNVTKIMFDAYQQVSTPGGERYPDVNKAINENVDRGALIVNYTGHGGEIGWAHESVLGISDIKKWNNIKNMPVFVTATCEFSRFDDPGRTSAGELVILNAKGGGIALLTTVRVVYSSPNFKLTKSFYRKVFEEYKGETPAVGDVFMQVKNQVNDANARNFTLLGDPALPLAYPEYDVQTISVNGVPSSKADTIRALSKVTVVGYVSDKSGQKLKGYNGVLYPTIFDKKKQITTQDNDNQGPFNFETRESKLFKGKASVKNGMFNFSFIVPKDIAYNYGKGKASYYAEDGSVDANGHYNNFIIGGTSSNFAEDNTGPDIQLYMNDEGFISGGITNENPVLLAHVYDEHGINMVGSGLGHDIVAILDQETDDAVVLNDYYEADLDSYQSGKVEYPFSELEEGKHTLTFKVWDVYNNSSEATIEFVVVKSDDIVLKHVLNYPNPFTTNTEFWFEHNQPGRPLNVNLKIFTVSGKVVKSINRTVQTEGYRSNSIAWDGLDDFGDKIGRGVYVYKLKVSNSDGSTAEKIEKLVVL